MAKMQASVEFRPQYRDLGVVMREVDENLAIFLGIRNGEKDKSDNPLIGNSHEFDDSKEDVKEQDSAEKSQVISSKSELAKNSWAAGKRRPSSSGERKRTPGAATPTGLLPMRSKPSRATSKTTLTSSIKPQMRSSTPPRATIKSSASDSDRSSSGRKTGPTMPKNPAPSNGTRQTVKSSDAPQITKTSLPKRPASASRVRPSAPAKHLSSSNGKPRQKSCSPPKIRASNHNAARNGNNIVLSRSRGYSNGGDDVNPVVMGTKMVERVVNMRKLAPPKQDGYVSTDNPKKSSLENSGFGRSLSKKSLDMAIRHMDIRRSIPDNLRPIATVISSSSRGIRSSSPESSTVCVAESPLTSSSGSSKSTNGVNNIRMGTEYSETFLYNN